MKEDSKLRHHPDPELPHRDSDFDLVARIGKFIDRYRVVYFVVGALFAWWGRNVIAPLRTTAQTTYEVRSIHAILDTVVIPHLYRIDANDALRLQGDAQQNVILGILTRLQCLRTSAIDRAKIGLDCRDIPVEYPKQSGL